MRSLRQLLGFFWGYMNIYTYIRRVLIVSKHVPYTVSIYLYIRGYMDICVYAIMCICILGRWCEMLHRFSLLLVWCLLILRCGKVTSSSFGQDTHHTTPHHTRAPVYTYARIIFYHCRGLRSTFSSPLRLFQTYIIREQ